MEEPAPGNKEAVQTFMTVAGCDERLAIHILEAYGFDLNAALSYYLEHPTEAMGAVLSTEEQGAHPDEEQELAEALAQSTAGVALDEDQALSGLPGASQGPTSLHLPRIVDAHEPAATGAGPIVDLTDDFMDLSAPAAALPPWAERQQRTRPTRQTRSRDPPEDDDAYEDLARLVEMQSNRITREDALEALDEDAEQEMGGRAGPAPPRGMGPSHARFLHQRRERQRSARRLAHEADRAGAGPAYPPPTLTHLDAAFEQLRQLTDDRGPTFLPAAGLAHTSQGRGNGSFDLPPDIDLEEARMLEAALLGIPFDEAQIPSHRRPLGPGTQGGALPGGDPDDAWDAYRDLDRLEDPAAQAQRQLRAEQDAAYEESLRADQLKARLAEEREAQERAAQEAREAAARLAAEREQQEKEELAQLLSNKAAGLPQEPHATDTDAVTVMIRLPGGGRCSRRFHASDAVSSLFDWVDSSQHGMDGVPLPGRYRLVAQFPRRVMDENDLRTLRDAGLTGRNEALMLEPM